MSQKLIEDARALYTDLVKKYGDHAINIACMIIYISEHLPDDLVGNYYRKLSAGCIGMFADKCADISNEKLLHAIEDVARANQTLALLAAEPSDAQIDGGLISGDVKRLMQVVQASSRGSSKDHPA